ncbi:hypothetical protein PC9H_005994 [Pleurotus ostreatus]|uniref:MACPF domain-containing protein n=1 Tax=Pleurotus ostreatus TaxID=5322 RepID=A0A8H7DR43_PLEOS|nr:uncharacterized protein PC9H_005994 [Pleurotus ostreatus]KAF7430290.1 hypothetical protein PC9H_005994 [Pleurotus ostreatus]KAJ8701395.1 hypothetical protein PTI98_000185 [Pleurotus ostreatus]
MEFPPVEQLGYGLNMLTTTPLKVDAVIESIRAPVRLLDYDEYDTRPYEVDGVTYAVPKAIGVSADANTISSTFTTYKTGGEASFSFQNDGSLASLYCGVTGNASVNAATNKMFRNTNQWAFYCFYKNRYLAQLKNYGSLLQVNPLAAAIRRLPEQFDGDNKTTVAAYKNFFDTYGTHLITKVRRGSRLLLQAWGDNSDQTINAQWTAYIRAYYGGIPSGGEYDESVKQQAHYQTFKNIVQYSNSVQGGDPQTAGRIMQNPSKYDEFQKWADSVDSHASQLSGLVVTELWTVMELSSSEYLQDAAARIETAFLFILNNPSVYKTAVTLHVESDWAEFGLITPSAVILPGERIPNLTVISETKVNFGKEKSHVYYREIINFYVVNDGSPIDFYISHGSLAGAGKGTARIVMAGKSYENNDIIDDDYNTKWFYQAPVGGTPESFHLKHRVGGINAWDATLDAYLKTQRVEEGPTIGHVRVGRDGGCQREEGSKE